MKPVAASSATPAGNKDADRGTSVTKGRKGERERERGTGAEPYEQLDGRDGMLDRFARSHCKR
jgi:hypothetical protein